MALLAATPAVMVACEKEIERPEVTAPLMPDLGPEGQGGVELDDVSRTVICQAAATGLVYRIPSIATANDGSLLVFAEMRHNSWLDKSYTDVVVFRSTNGGESWEDSRSLTGSINDGNYAFMDPTPIVDAQTGEIFLFCTRWNKLNDDAKNNLAYMVRSTDNGVTWSAPVNMSGSVLADGHYSAGFGPGHGIQIKEGKYAGRLVAITRQYNGSKQVGYAIYSDDHGKTWNVGDATAAAEAQIAESGVNSLHMNLRRGDGSRNTSKSINGGISWSTAVVDMGLPVMESGCEASVLGTGDNMVFYSGPKGQPKTSSHDDRVGLMLYRSATSANGWTRKQELYTLAAGYSDMTLLQDGRLAIVFEAGPEAGFTRKGNRPAGWMRLDLIVLPAEVTDYDFWFSTDNN